MPCNKPWTYSTARPARRTPSSPRTSCCPANAPGSLAFSHSDAGCTRCASSKGTRSPRTTHGHSKASTWAVPSTHKVPTACGSQTSTRWSRLQKYITTRPSCHGDQRALSVYLILALSQLMEMRTSRSPFRWATTPAHPPRQQTPLQKSSSGLYRPPADVRVAIRRPRPASLGTCSSYSRDPRTVLTVS